VVAPFLKSWVIGQIYALMALVSAVLGVSLALTNLPF
jgi:hypothetical protein